MHLLVISGNLLGMPTGYGTQSLEMVRGLRRAGHTVSFLTWGLLNPGLAFQRITMPHLIETNPTMRKYLTDDDMELFSSDTHVVFHPYETERTTKRYQDINVVIQKHKVDMCILFHDIFVIEPGPLKCPTLVWMPVHFMPLEHRTLMSLQMCDGIVAMSEYGRDFLSQVLGPDRADILEKRFYHIPHGRPPKVFRPPDSFGTDAWEDEHVTRKKEMGWPEDAFCVLMIASNSEQSNRKAFDAQIQAFARFSRRMNAEGRKVHGYFHTDGSRAADLPRILELVGLCPDRSKFIAANDPTGHSFLKDVDDVSWASSDGMVSWRISTHKDVCGFDEPTLIRAYHAADVLLAASCSEGFGVPIIEAQLCGCPVVTNRTTAMTELTYFGMTCEPAQFISRNDFVAGWMQPSSKNVANALYKIAGWTPETRFARFEEHSEFFTHRYSSEEIGRNWADVVGHFGKVMHSLSPHRTFELDLCRRHSTAVYESEHVNAALSRAIGRRDAMEKHRTLAFAMTNTLRGMSAH